jgi:hypothetical protein
MLGRRMYHRHLIADSRGTLHVSTEVTVQRRGEKELIATADEAHMPGELLSIDLVDRSGRGRTYVRVLESCPILMDGTIRHRLRLTPLEDAEV